MQEVGICPKATHETLFRYFQKYKSTYPDSFTSSPIYYWLTGRKGAWLHEGDSSFLVTCIHPHDENCILVFPETGDLNGALTVRVLELLANNVEKYEIRLARNCQASLIALQRALTERPHKNLINVNEVPEYMMDWKYPVRILCTTTVANLYGATFQKVRTKYRKAKQHISYRQIKNDSDLNLAMKVVEKWQGKPNRSSTQDDSFEFYEKILSATLMLNEHLVGLIFLDGEHPVGFCVWDYSGADTANSLANLANSTMTGLAEFQMVTICKWLRKERVPFLNLGGSETEGLDRYKLKFRPATSLEIKSIKVTYSIQDYQSSGLKSVPNSTLQPNHIPLLPFGYSLHVID